MDAKDGRLSGRKEGSLSRRGITRGRKKGGVSKKKTFQERRKGGKKEGGWMGEESQGDLEWSNKKRKGKEDEGVRKRGRSKNTK